MKGIYILLVVAVITAIFVLSLFAIWKDQYTKYNLLRLDPLEESKIDLNEIRNAKGEDSVIWLVGDSRIAQWNTNLLKPLNCKIINLGIEGQTSKQVLENFKKQFSLFHPRCVVIQVGINDFKVLGLQENKTNEIISNCYSNTIEIINFCQSNNVTVVYMPVMLTGEIEMFRRLIWNSVIEKELSKFNSRMKDYCLINNVLYFDVVKIFEEIPVKERKKYQKGFLHLSNEGYKFLSKEFILFYETEITEHKQN